MREARQHKHTHRIMNENNMDHSMENWEEDQFINVGGRRSRSLSEFDVHGSPQMGFSVLVPLVRGDFLHKQKS